MSRAPLKTPHDPDAVVTWTPDGDGYGVVTRSWEDSSGRRDTRVTREGAEGVACGFGVEFRVEAGW